MASNLVINTGALVQVQDISFSLAQLSNGGRDRYSGITEVENAILLNLAKGVTADALATNGLSLDGSAYKGVSLTGPGTNFRLHAEVNNTVMDTPNFALMTYISDQGLDISYAEALIGGANSLNKRVSSETGSSVYQSETITFNVSDNSNNSLNCDASNAWFVSFDSRNSNNYFLSKAVNSELMANSNGNSFYPIRVIEPSFNVTNALCTAGGNVASTLAFDNYYEFDSNNGPSLVPFTNNIMIGGNKMFKVTSVNGANPLYNVDIGTWRIKTLDPSGSIVSTANFSKSVQNIVGTSSLLPFKYVDNQFARSSLMSENDAANLPDGNSPSADVFNTLFPLINVSDEFVFTIGAQSGRGGGYFVNSSLTNGYSTYSAIELPNSGNPSTKVLSSGITDRADIGSTDISNSLLTIDSTVLENNTLYMRNNYQRKNHSIDISNGYLKISGDWQKTVDLLNAGLSSGTERLNRSDASTDGQVKLSIQPINNRVTVLSDNVTYLDETHNSTYNFLICYDASDAKVAWEIYDVSGSGDISSNPLLNTIRTSQVVDVSATVLLSGSLNNPEGLYFYDASGIVNDMNAIYRDSDQTSNMYTQLSIDNTNNPLSYDASGLTGLKGQDAIHITVKGFSELVADPDGLWGLAKLPNGETVSEFDAFGNTIPPADTPVNAGYNTPFITPSVTVSKSNLSSLSSLGYNNIRVLLETKTFSDLSNNDGLNLSSFKKGQADASACSFVMGSASLLRNHKKTFTVDENPERYLLQSYNNISDNVGGEAATYVPIQNLPGYDTPIINYGLTTEYLADGVSNSSIISYNCKFKMSSSNIHYVDFLCTTPNLLRSGSNNPYYNFSKNTIHTQDNDNNDLDYFQLPFGSYTNLYINLPAKTQPGDSYTFTVSFKVSALFGLKGYLQGADFGTDYKSENNSWTNITLDASFADVEAFTTNTASVKIRPTGSNIGTLTINLKENKDDDSEYLIMANPRYVVALDQNVGQNASIIVGRQYSIANINDPANIVSNVNAFKDFNPATSPVVNIPGSKQLTFDVSMTIVDASTMQLLLTTRNVDISNVSFAIQYPNQLVSDFSIWYCPEDIYNVIIRAGSSENSLVQVSHTAVKSGHPYVNNYAVLSPGIVIINTYGNAPGHGVQFRLNPEQVAVNFVTGQSYGGPYDFNDVVDLSGSLLAGNPLVTRTLTFPWYRGYHCLDGFNGETQTYTIERHGTTASFNIYDASGSNAYFKKLQTSDVDVYNGSNNTVDLALVTDLSYSLGNLGLLVNFQQSMLKKSVTGLRVPIDVRGDTFSVSSSRVDFSNNRTYASNVYGKDIVSKNLLDLSGGVVYAYPKEGSVPTNALAQDSSRCIVAGRVTAGGYGNVTNGSTLSCSNVDQTYTLQKTDSAVEIKYNTNYIGNPNMFTFNDNLTDINTIIVKNRDLSGGIQLTPNIKLQNNYSIGRDPTNSPNTFLVSFPPVYAFSAYDTTVTSSLPYNITGSDPSYTQFVRILKADGTSDSYEPFPGTDGVFSNNANLNSIVFTRNATPSYSSLTKARFSQRNISVKGNYLNLVERAGGATLRSLYTGYIQDMPAGSPFRSGQAVVANLLTSANFNSNHKYVFSYNQDVSNLQRGAVGPNINASIETEFFSPGSYAINISPTSVSKSVLLGVKPIVDEQGKYQLQAYKYTDITSVNYMSTDLVNKLTNIGFVSSSYSSKQITLRDASFNGTPYSLSSTLASVLSTDVSGAWTTVDTDPTVLPFNLVALSNPIGIKEIFKLIKLDPASENLTVGYFTLPDLVNATSADGAPVYRVTYNGMVAAPAISTNAITLASGFTNNVPNDVNNNVTTASPNKEFVNFNVSGNKTTF